MDKQGKGHQERMPSPPNHMSKNLFRIVEVVSERGHQTHQMRPLKG
jgi:hypothetical protein